MRDFFKKIITALITAQARLILKKFKPRIVAVTGSVGKTSTKDAIYAVVSQSYHARKSEKSFNSEIGIPLTIIGVPNAWGNPFGWARNLIEGLTLILLGGSYPEWLILEVGADRPGDIKRIAKWLKVDIAVITRLPEVPVHVEFFDSPEEIVEEKAALIKALKSNGVLVLYGDDEQTRNLEQRAAGMRVITFGLAPNCEVRAERFTFIREGGESTLPLGMGAQLVVGERLAPIEVVGTMGAHALLPLVGGAAVGAALGKDLADIVEALKGYTPPPGRMRLLRGLKESLIIDDSYNASPAAVSAALETLADIQTEGRKIALLGDMTELGRYSIDEHRKIGAQVAVTCDLLFAVGIRARDIAEGALKAKMKKEKIFLFDDARQAGGALDDILAAGDCVLVKGSQAMRMERTVEQVMAEPARAKELLVRQDAEWRRR